MYNMRSINSGRLTATVSLFALAAAFAPGAAAAQAPDACANAADEAARQACMEAVEAADATATSGDDATAATQASAEATQAESSETIVVTGSRLRRDERNSPDPVTIIDPSLENREGKFDTAEVLQSSPLAAGSTQITSTLSTNFVVNGGEGVQTVSLRGLGANRTLVLLNGRRAGPAGVRGGVSAFDLNVIPVDAIQSIDILKTGASSIYGSDAVAGVVNLITKKDLRGLDVRGFVSIPQEGGGEQYSLSATYGGAIGERGHYMIGANYYRHRELERGDRSFLGCPELNVRSEATGEIVDPIDPRTGEVMCGDFISNQIQVQRFGMVGNNLLGPCVPAAPGAPSGTNGCAVGFVRRAINTIQYDPSLGSILTTANFGERFFNPTNITQFDAPVGFFPVGTHERSSWGALNQWDPRVAGDSVIPDTKRFTIFAEAGYELSDRVDLYVEGLYNRRKTQTDASRQLFFFQFPGNAATGYGAPAPYFICAGGYYAEGEMCDPLAAGDPFNAGFSGAALLTPIVWAPFDSGTDIKYYRGVAGVRANLDNILPNGFLDFHVQHSRSDGDYNRTIIFRDAIEFGVAEWRTNSCVGTNTAIRGVPCLDIDYTDPRVLAGNYTQAEMDFLFGQDKGNTLYKQTSAEVTVGGDVFELPAGPVKVAIGAHIRRDSINDTPGEHTLAGNLWGSTTSGVTAGFQRTREVFGEIEIPILEDAPFAESLTFTGAARLTNTYAKRDFDGADDADRGNWTYKLAGNWQVTDWLRFRATYGTSFRSPALFEQFLANESGFLGQGADPCIDWQNTENSQIQQNCAAQGIPDDYNGVGSSFETFSGGGVGVLDPETSKAWTASVILTPQSWLWEGGKFSFAVDYIDIKVKDQVTQLGAANILFACYTSESFPDDPLCDLFERAPEGAPDEFNIRTVLDPFVNIDTQHNKSLDFTTRFRQDLGNLGTLSILGQMTYQLKDKFTLFQGIEADFNGEEGDPKWVGDLNVTWQKAPFTITYGLQVISKTSDQDDFEDDNAPLPFPGTRTPNNCLSTGTAHGVLGGNYCPVIDLPRVAYHSISAEIEAAKGFTFLFGVSNLFDKKPPLVSTFGTSHLSGFAQVPLLGSYYDYYGRRFFVSAKAKF
jgi:iron complex outermembrane receptor protein